MIILVVEKYSMKKIFLFLLLIICTISFSQKKTLQTVQIKGGITIDGNLDEPNWQMAPVAKDFFMFAPDNGEEVEKSNDTHVKILYDNEAIYIGAILFDEEPTKILKELTLLDDQGTSEISVFSSTVLMTVNKIFVFSAQLQELNWIVWQPIPMVKIFLGMPFG